MRERRILPEALAEADARSEPGVVRCMTVGGVKLGGPTLRSLGLDAESLAALTSLE
jgi:hypothetical protein